MAHTKAKGTTKLGRDSESKRLGVKIFGGSPIKCGQIIIRQRGTKYIGGEGTRRGGDDTLYAARDGLVEFKKIKRRNFTGNKQVKMVVLIKQSQMQNANLVGLRSKGWCGQSQNGSVKFKNKGEEPIQKNIKPEEIKEATQSVTEREIIRNEEPPKIPARADVRKKKF